MELFTSQGCSSCPPAERVLEEIKQSKFPGGKVIPLAFHVDYWDHIGWKDPFSHAAFTNRQWLYSRVFRRRNVYTPQTIVDGTTELVGSHEAEVLTAIRRRLARRAEWRLSLSVDTGVPGRFRLWVEAEYLSYNPALEAKWLCAATFLPESTTRVGAGENSGRTIRQVNIVRMLAEPVPFKTGGKPVHAKFDLPRSPGESVAVWIQDYRTYAIEQAEIWE